MPCRLPYLLNRYLVAWVPPFDGFLPNHHLLLMYLFFELEGPCFSVSAYSGNFRMISMPADLSSSSPWTTLSSSQPKGARKVLVLPLLTPASHCSKSGRPQVIRHCLSFSWAIGVIPPFRVKRSRLRSRGVAYSPSRRSIRVGKSRVL